MKQTFNFSFINLGCTKNLVDTQHLMGHIFDIASNNPNYDVNYVTDPYDTQVKYVFLNTCGFIKTGRDEMFATIARLLKAKKNIYLLGCAVQYFQNIVKTPRLPRTELRGGASEKKRESLLKNKSICFLSRNDLQNITIAKLLAGYDSKHFGDYEFPSNSPQAYTNAEYHFEYLKIAEGCDNHCTFCIIPQIRGKQKSLQADSIAQEVKNMLQAGIQEIILIAQDTSTYGTDLYPPYTLLKLLKKIDCIPGNFKYRILYLYPDTLSEARLYSLKSLKKFIPYFDIPLQHISSHLLKRMGRDSGKDAIHRVSLIKNLFPQNYMRTNFIIGFPGETEYDHKKLLGFINKGYFDNIALFEYHDEPYAASSKLDQKVPENTIRRRFTQAKQLVNQQLLDHEEKRKGKKFTGYITDIIPLFLNSKHSSLLIVRPQIHAPEIDPYDEIYPDQIIKIHNESKKIFIGNKITYKLC